MFITLTELRYVLALADEQHFGRAAQRCFVSQPTLSIAIKKLEDNLGISLFERDKRSLMITENGQQVIAKARQVFRLLDDIDAIAKQHIDVYSWPLKVGAIYTVGPYLFPKILGKLKQEESKLQLIIEEGFTHGLVEKLHAGVLDAIIVAEPFHHPNLTTIKLYTERLDVILPLEHPWKNKRRILPSDISNETMLLLNSGNCFRDQVLNICPECSNLHDSTSSNKMITTSSLETIKQMVASGLGISIVPHYSLYESDAMHILCKRFCVPEPKRHISLAYRSSFSRTAVIKELGALITALM